MRNLFLLLILISTTALMFCDRNELTDIKTKSCTYDWKNKVCVDEDLSQKVGY